WSGRTYARAQAECSPVLIQPPKSCCTSDRATWGPARDSARARNSVDLPEPLRPAITVQPPPSRGAVRGSRDSMVRAPVKPLTCDKPIPDTYTRPPLLPLPGAWPPPHDEPSSGEGTPSGPASALTSV